MIKKLSFQLRISASFVVLLFLSGCSNHCSEKEPVTLSKAEMLAIVKTMDEKFNEGVKKKDYEFITSIYTDSAKYVQPNRNRLIGKDSIRKEWKEFIENNEILSLKLYPETVNGVTSLIYETGKGTTTVLQKSDTVLWNFNYINIWVQQPDGSYKLDIDTYN